MIQFTDFLKTHARLIKIKIVGISVSEAPHALGKRPESNGAGVLQKREPFN